MNRIIHPSTGLALPLIYRNVARIHAPIQNIKRSRWTPDHLRLARPEKLSGAVIRRQLSFHTISQPAISEKPRQTWRPMDLVLPTGAQNENKSTSEQQASASNLLKTLMARQNATSQIFPQESPAPTPAPVQPAWKKPDAGAQVFRRVEEIHVKPSQPETSPASRSEPDPVPSESAHFTTPVQAVESDNTPAPQARVFRKAWKEEIPNLQNSGSEEGSALADIYPAVDDQPEPWQSDETEMESVIPQAGSEIIPEALPGSAGDLGTPVEGLPASDPAGDVNLSVPSATENNAHQGPQHANLPAPTTPAEASSHPVAHPESRPASLPVIRRKNSPAGPIRRRKSVEPEPRHENPSAESSKQAVAETETMPATPIPTADESDKRINRLGAQPSVAPTGAPINQADADEADADYVQPNPVQPTLATSSETPLTLRRRPARLPHPKKSPDSTVQRTPQPEQMNPQRNRPSPEQAAASLHGALQQPISHPAEPIQVPVTSPDKSGSLSGPASQDAIRPIPAIPEDVPADLTRSPSGRTTAELMSRNNLKPSGDASNIQLKTVGPSDLKQSAFPEPTTTLKSGETSLARTAGGSDAEPEAAETEKPASLPSISAILDAPDESQQAAQAAPGEQPTEQGTAPALSGTPDVSRLSMPDPARAPDSTVKPGEVPPHPELKMELALQRKPADSSGARDRDASGHESPTDIPGFPIQRRVDESSAGELPLPSQMPNAHVTEPESEQTLLPGHRMSGPNQPGVSRKPETLDRDTSSQTSEKNGSSARVIAQTPTSTPIPVGGQAEASNPQTYTIPPQGSAMQPVLRRTSSYQRVYRSIARSLEREAAPEWRPAQTRTHGLQTERSAIPDERMHARGERQTTFILRKFQPLAAEASHAFSEDPVSDIPDSLQSGSGPADQPDLGHSSRPVQVEGLQAKIRLAGEEPSIIPGWRPAQTLAPASGIRPRLRRETLVSRVAAPVMEPQTPGTDHLAMNEALTVNTPWPAPVRQGARTETLSQNQSGLKRLSDPDQSPWVTGGRADTGIAGSLNPSMTLHAGEAHPVEPENISASALLRRSAMTEPLILRRLASLPAAEPSREQGQSTVQAVTSQSSLRTLNRSASGGHNPSTGESAQFDDDDQPQQIAVADEAGAHQDGQELEDDEHGAVDSSGIPEPELPDIRDLARQVYPLIKRMLANERERTFGRRA